MAPRSFLSFPHELRHNIYREYFALKNGYAFQPGPGKLAASDGEPLDLALMYTCRFIASETKDMPLALNIISFSTVFHPDWRNDAGRLDYLLDFQEKERYNLLIYLSRFVTPRMYSEIEMQFPWFVPMLEATERRYRGQELCHEDLSEHESWVFECGPHRRSRFKIPLVGTPPSFSALCSATDFTLRLLDREPNPELAKEIEQAMGRMRRSPGGLTSLVDQSFKRWDIPDWNDLAMAGRRSQDRELWKSLCSWQGPGGRSRNKEYKLKFGFSAAAAAIRFIKHLPTNKRLCIRHLLLREDGVAVGRQERHSVGLIPYCKENPRLRIDQRLGMVKNIFQAAGLTKHSFSLIHGYATGDQPEDIFHTVGMHRDWRTRVESWMIEATALPGLGMPKDSFTLTLDGECVPDICSDFFQQIVLRNVAIQQAIHERFPYPAGIIPSEDLWEGINPYCIQAFKCLVNQSSILRSNFHPGVMWDVDKMIADHPEYEHREWWQLFWNTGHYTIPDSIHSVPLASMLLDNYEFRKIRQRTTTQNRQYESWYH